MNLWHAVILGLVEGITEYLPISSTGHLIIASSLLGLDSSAQVKAATDQFLIVVQGGAILAVVGLYRARIVQMVRGLLGRDVDGRRLLINLAIAFFPAAIVGLLLEDLIERHLFSMGPVLAALLLGGIWMIWLDRHRRTRAARMGVRLAAPESEEDLELARATGEISLDELPWQKALAIGLFQVVALWPGTSRSMMTIAGGTSVGLRPREAAEFSFLLGLPTLGGACVYKLGKDVLRSRSSDVPAFYEVLGAGPVILGIVIATLSAALAVSWLVRFLTRHGLHAFGWYRIALCGVLGGLILLDVVDLEG